MSIKQFPQMQWIIKLPLFLWLLFFSQIFPNNLNAQAKLDEILLEVQQNNLGLETNHKQNLARQIEHKTNIYLPNPEFGFNYLLSNPASLGNRRDFSLIQEFDFPTSYRYRSQLAELNIEQSSLIFQQQKKSLTYQVSLLFHEIVYAQLLKVEYTSMREAAIQLASAYQKRLEHGDANVLEVNKIKLFLLNTEHELKLIETEVESLFTELKNFNGGKDILFSSNHFELEILPNDVEVYWAEISKNNPWLLSLEKEIEQAQKEIQLAKALQLPKWSAGYMNEIILGQEVQGLTIGVSLPLWENKNRVKFAKADLLASESLLAQAQLNFQTQFRKAYQKAYNLHHQIIEFEQTLNSINSTPLLTKALESGEISLIQYLLELNFYFESKLNLLLLKRDYCQTLTELKQFETIN